MHFNSLKEKCEYFRSLTDYKLVPNSYVIAMLDGHRFSRLVKNRYKKPFDKDFMTMMNDTAAYLLKRINGAKFAYVQSDEISILITDFDTPETDSPFGYRTCKLESLMAGMASAKFSMLTMRNEVNDWPGYEPLNPFEIIDDHNLAEFDCKVWNVPSWNEVFAWFLWRQNDCTRNSKQQAAQTYFPHKELMGLDTDEQVAKLLDEKGIDWNSYTDGEKYGRLIYKEYVTVKAPNGEEVERSRWLAHDATPFSEEYNVIRTLIPNRNE